jgi:hypothetical protein
MLESPSPLTRVTVISQDHEFFVTQPSFTSQYDTITTQRSALMLPMLKSVIRAKWPTIQFVERLIDVHSFPVGVDLVISGLIFKDSKRRPNVIKLFQKDRSLTKIYRPSDNFVDDKDLLFVEDPHSRVQLSGNISVHSFVTGVPLAALGQITDTGFFDVRETASLSLPPQPHRLVPGV